MAKLVKRILLSFRNRGKHVVVSKNANVALSSSFEGYNRIGENSFYSGSMGYATYMGDDCHIIADVGRFCCIASRVVTVRGSHPIKDWISLHPAFFSTARQCGMTFVEEDKYEEKKKKIRIGNDVWIGDSAILLDGITIGDGAVIGAGAVVTKDVLPYSVVVGVPAKEIKRRFSEEEIAHLLQVKWWNQPFDWIRENVEAFENFESFFEHTKEMNKGE